VGKGVVVVRGDAGVGQEQLQDVEYLCHRL
jgi:hypothetical protein